MAIMRNSYHSHANSLFALEQSLFGENPADQTAEMFSAEGTEDIEAEAEQSQPAEAQAFDWDESIELGYQSEVYPAAFSDDELDEDELDAAYPAAMSWQDTEDTGHFEQGEADPPTYDVKAFAVDAAAAAEEDAVPFSQGNSLFALEQSLFGPLPQNLPAQQFSVEEDEEIDAVEEALSQQIEAQAFDWDESIELQYQQEADPTAMSFDWLPAEESSYGLELEEEPPTYDVEAFAVDEDESLPFQVEAFAVDEAAEMPFTEENYADSMADAGDDATDNANNEAAEDFLPDYAAQSSYDSGTYQAAYKEAYQAAYKEAYKQVYGEAYGETHGFDGDDDTLEPATESDTSRALETDNAPEPTRQPEDNSKAIPVEATIATPASPPCKLAEPIDDFDQFDQAAATDRAPDAKAFTADLEAILRGEKVYEPAAEAPVPAPAAPVSQAQSVAAQPPAAPLKQPTAHNIFDQLGHNLAHATAFDLGTFSLEQRFDEFDRLLDEQESLALAQPDESPASTDAEETDDEPNLATPFAFDDDDLAADGMAFSADPWQAMQLQLEDSEIDQLVKNNPPTQKELKDLQGKYFQRLKHLAKKQKTYQPDVDNKRISQAINQNYQAPAKKQLVSQAPKITGAELKQRYWHHISIGGTESNPEEISGYHWSGANSNPNAKFKPVGTPTQPDQFGVYQQYIQHENGTYKPDPSTFFPDAWTEQHFDDLFQQIAQAPSFNPAKSGTYEILAPLARANTYRGMKVLLMPSQDGGTCIPNYLYRDDAEVLKQLLREKPRVEAKALEYDDEFGEQFSSWQEDERLEDELGEALEYGEDEDENEFGEALEYDEEIVTEGSYGNEPVMALGRDKPIVTLLDDKQQHSQTLNQGTLSNRLLSALGDHFGKEKIKFTVTRSGNLRWTIQVEGKELIAERQGDQLIVYENDETSEEIETDDDKGGKSTSTWKPTQKTGVRQQTAKLGTRVVPPSTQPTTQTQPTQTQPTQTQPIQIQPAQRRRAERALLPEGFQQKLIADDEELLALIQKPDAVIHFLGGSENGVAGLSVGTPQIVFKLLWDSPCRVMFAYQLMSDLKLTVPYTRPVSMKQVVGQQIVQTLIGPNSKWQKSSEKTYVTVKWFTHELSTLLVMEHCNMTSIGGARGDTALTVLNLLKTKPQLWIDLGKLYVIQVFLGDSDGLANPRRISVQNLFINLSSETLVCGDLDTYLPCGSKCNVWNWDGKKYRLEPSPGFERWTWVTILGEKDTGRLYPTEIERLEVIGLEPICGGEIVLEQTGTAFVQKFLQQLGEMFSKEAGAAQLLVDLTAIADSTLIPAFNQGLKLARGYLVQNQNAIATLAVNMRKHYSDSAPSWQNRNLFFCPQSVGMRLQALQMSQALNPLNMRQVLSQVLKWHLSSNPFGEGWFENQPAQDVPDTGGDLPELEQLLPYIQAYNQGQDRLKKTSKESKKPEKGKQKK